MANWCSTTYKVVGEDKELQELYSALQRAERSGHAYLRKVVAEMGVDADCLYCRGEVLDFSFEDECVTIWQETAWTEQGDFRRAIESKYPSLKVYYKEEEPGCKVYSTNDEYGTFFPERFLLESEECTEYYEDLSDLASCISIIVEKKVETMEDIEDALSKWNDAHEKECEKYYVHEIEITY